MKLSHLLFSSFVVTSLVGCGNLSKVTHEGTSENLVWPKIEDSGFSHNGGQYGSWPNWDNVRMIERGMNKEQIYNLIGRPHFAEGFWGVREWDYAFNYRENGEHKICQYKILFDKNMTAQNFFWYPDGCNGTSSFSLKGELLFDFDKDTLSDKGLEIVDNVAKQLNKIGAKNVKVSGHTDRLGDTEYNLQLSQRRAERVKERLVKDGVVAEIEAVGYGKAYQVKACDNVKKQLLKDCLHENRRVEISSSGLLSKETKKGGSTGPAPLYDK